MSELGQSRQFGDVRATSALPPKTDICRKRRHVSNAAEPVRFSVDSEVIDSRSGHRVGGDYDNQRTARATGGR